jgi:hypothetical protein
MLDTLLEIENCDTVDDASQGEDRLSAANVLKEEQDEIGYQEEIGVFLKRELSDHALVISQGWPSWSYALEGLGFKSVSTLASFDSITSREEFKATSMGDTLINQKELNNWLESHCQDGILFVQGERTFLETAYHRTIDLYPNLKLVYICTNTKFFTADGYRLSHANSGGVTDGEWTYYLEGLSPDPVPITKVSRNLGHVLRTTESASSERKIHAHGGIELSNTDRVPWHNEQCHVITKSVFHRNLLVRRIISRDEWMDIYDLELSTQNELKSYWRENNINLPSMAFVNQIPVKVLRIIATSVASSLVKKPIDIAKSESQNSLDSGQTLVRNNLGVTIDIDDEVSIDSLDNNSLAGEAVLTDVPDRAARNDDDEADIEDWDRWSVSSFKPRNGIEPLVCKGEYDSKTHKVLFDALRKLLIRRYRKNVLQSLLRYLNKRHSNGSEYDTNVVFGKRFKVSSWVRNKRKLSKKQGKFWELSQDLDVGRDAIRRAAWSTWWNWDNGSTLYFWRWPSEVRKAVRDGTKLFVDWKKMPRYMKSPTWPRDENQKEKLEAKLRKVRDRGYIQPGFVKSLTGFFAVPKASTDIRVVYDATQCGLNEALWSPNFFLPTVDSILRNASSATWFGDIDLGEMFLNYALDLDLRPYAGIDVTDLDKTLIGKTVSRIFERWTRTLIGFRPSPYVCTQTFAWGEEVIVGNRMKIDNPFYWDQVILNFPGTSTYDTTMPVVYRWDSKRKRMPCFFGTYIDDIRSGGPSEEGCQAVTHRIASRVNYLGQQDAVRKRGHPAKVPRAWAGAKCIAIDNQGLYVLSTVEKWKKVQALVAKWITLVEETKDKMLSYSELEKDVGFLCHMSRTYPAAFPYLKGFYNSLNGWRLDRNRDGWKIGRTAWMEMLSGDTLYETEEFMALPFEVKKRKFFEWNKKEKPETIVPVPRFHNDLKALQSLFSNGTPTRRLVRGSKIGTAVFGFGDASGGGFGSSWESSRGTAYRFGTWGDDMSDQSSNLREFTNLVDTLVEMGKQGVLEGTEVFLFTDNSTSEAAFFNGSSTSEKLFELVLKVRKMEMDNGSKIHLCHVSGERMKVQGSDGLSRGNLNVGVMAGRSMLDFVPIHLSALDRSSTLRPWVEDWTQGDDLEWLSPSDWYTRGHDLVEETWEKNVDNLDLPTFRPGFYVWEAAPVAAEAMIEELRKARHKRQKSHHLILLPRLMEPQWRKSVYKAADIVLSLPAGHAAWPKDMFEPLTIAFVFPFINHRPWQLRGSPYLLELGRKLSCLWRDNSPGERFILRELWGVQRKLFKMQKELAWKVLHCQSVGDIPDRHPRKRRRNSVEKKSRGASVPKRKKR